MIHNKKILILVLLGLITLASAQVDTAWVRRYNPYDSTDTGYKIAIDGSGNVYVTGVSRGNGLNGSDYATVKYDALGVQQWASRYNGPASGADVADGGIVVDQQGNVIVTGYSVGATTGFDMATVKYNSSGIEQWASRYDCASGIEYGKAIAVDDTGNIYVTGYSVGSGTSGDCATIKYKPDGDTAWVRRWTSAGSNSDWGYAIAVDSFRNVYVAGSATGSGTDLLMIKYRPDGETLWTRTYNCAGTSADRASSIAIGPSGNIYLTGYTMATNSGDYLTIKYRANGDTAWTRRYDGPGTGGYDFANAIAIDASENVYITGYSRGSAGNDDIATVKYDS
jgi:hypothetical protein